MRSSQKWVRSVTVLKGFKNWADRDGWADWADWDKDQTFNKVLKTETMTHLVSWGPDPVLRKKITGRLVLICGRPNDSWASRD